MKNETLPALQSMFSLADAICAEIASFQPDLVVALANGGRAPLLAAQTLWPARETQPFPPTLVTNLGREKIERFDAALADLPLEFSSRFHGEYSLSHEIGYFLHWLNGQKDWLDRLHSQVVSVLGFEKQPARILIIDDTYQEGSTFYLSMGLLGALYPRASIHFIAGFIFEWRVEILSDWLIAQYPHFGEEEEKKTGQPLFHLIPGSEDVERDSLDWKPIERDSPLVEAVDDIISADHLLELSGLAYRRIETFVRENALLREIPGDWAGHGLSLRDQLPQRPHLYQYLWEHGRITRRQAANWLRVPLGEAARLLEREVEYGVLLPLDTGRQKGYTLSPEASGRLPAPDLPASAFWVSPRQFLVSGDLDAYGDEDTRKRIQRLLDLGVTSFLSLQSGPDDSADIESLVIDEGRRREHKDVSYLPVVFPQKRAPSRHRVEKILDMLDALLQSGQVILLSACGWRNDGANLVAACWLARRGVPTAEIFVRMNELRQGTERPWMPAPVKPAYRRMVKEWNAPGVKVRI